MHVLALTTLLLQPWHGKDLPTATQAAVKYRLTIAAPSGTIVHLRASKVAIGWIAAFCDSHVCSPMQATKLMPKSGKVVLQFELIRDDDAAPHTSGATIVPDSGKPVVVPTAKG